MTETTEPSAVSRVFNTPELAEAIFLNLPVQDVLIIQRVAKPWYDTIKGSKKLQRSLFFLPLPVELVQFHKYDKDKRSDPRWTTSRKDERSFKMLLNPFYTRLLEKRWSAAFARPEASWRKMFVCQPAPKVVLVVGSGGKDRRVKSEKKRGVVLDQLSGKNGEGLAVRIEYWFMPKVAGDVVLSTL